MPIADGAVFAGYTIERLLGTGGMGEVYLVQHPRLPRREALKILPASISAETEYRQRFAREADIAASLWHSHIVSVHDRGEHDGQLWITMDYVDGTDAAQLLRSRYPHGMPAEDALEIISAVADALDYAHERHLLHRDVKPANILLTDPRVEDRRILLADFGIARDTNDINGITATNIAVGSVVYAAPEQLTGSPLDGRADQYALACTAFHLLTGGPPFVNSNPAALIGSHLSSPPPRLANVRPDLSAFDHALTRAMAKEPYQRFNTCREFASALRQSSAAVAGAAANTQLATPAASYPTLFGGGATPSQPVYAHTAPPSPPAESATNKRTMWVAGGIAALLAVGLVAFIGARLGQPDDDSPTASPSTSDYPEPQFPRTRTVTQTPPETVTVTQPATRPPPPPAPSPPRPPTRGPGDLGLSIPISSPPCNGQWIVILGNVTTPGQYESGIQRLLNLHPGASYLRTDQSCPSLRARDDRGNVIYAVYRTDGMTESSACQAVRAAGGDAYGKRLDHVTDPNYYLSC